ncbi:hypothetical protein NT2_02_00670 [Caenibius tardaugens NBRC 16725]|uniref:BioF2-like acetyltransferase domain-containing protein n=1 Tax=Caenibius tardaugens NBRC 16725 TaxID=1219035 RepID=U2ZRJ2_9SPHN|nr:FemAB family XrtA/PEP-CTERM system-associated protein [Caenibius tardaugens]AZI38008.1 FemAB family PEP-CTERM system-associated protein [Caenibius tardaugens NBRC 16725]GAD47984.1 hypothetical protein NT2_02_00670 [Caenibius tardaugens NBRC 16725]
MNAPFDFQSDMSLAIRPADFTDPVAIARIEAFVADCDAGAVFHRPAWLQAVEMGTGQAAVGISAERAGRVVGWLPLTEVHSPLFGRALVSSGFGVGGGILATDQAVAAKLAHAAEELALRHSCATVELRGGALPRQWDARHDSHCGFAAPLQPDDETQLLAIPRKQRAEVRKGLDANLRVRVGTDEVDRAAHYGVYAESVRNLGTPVFPRSLFDAVLDRLDADILTVHHDGEPVASVLSLYHRGAVLPYWGGGTFAARGLRANDRMYFELMRHARLRGCAIFDFGRSKTGSGAYHFKRNWGFEARPLSYATWNAPGHAARDVDPTSARHAARIALWKRLPLALANRLGPFIAKGLG